GAAAMHDDRVHANELEHHHVPRKTGLERRLGHRVAAVLNHDRFVVEALDVWQRLGKNLRFERGGCSLHGHELWCRFRLAPIVPEATGAKYHAPLSMSKP